ncbi:MAG: GNAT family N-acetyltransferase [Chitinophagaceae bacterium]
MVEIIEYSHQYASEFKGLNLEWLDKYHLTEGHDLEILNDPQGTIIDAGGAIYLAKIGNDIVGTASLMKEKEGFFELAKMAVTPQRQGKGISKLLIEKCINKAMELNATKIFLFSNHQLQTAIQLYRKFGFENIDVTDSPFATADVKMELQLKKIT